MAPKGQRTFLQCGLSKCSFGEGILIGREFNTENKLPLLGFHDRMSWINKTNLRRTARFRTVLHLADPATFLASNSVLGTLFIQSLCYYLNNFVNVRIC